MSMYQIEPSHSNEILLSDTSYQIEPNAFLDIIEELERKPLENNKYRLKSGEGRSQAFGLVNRRCLPADYSRQCWMTAKLYHHILEFAEKYVDISYNAITLNQNYKCEPHYDKGNDGDSYLIAFGNFTGGDLKIMEGDLSGNHNIKYNPIKANFSKIKHCVEPFEGNRYSLVFYTLKKYRRDVEVPPPSVKYENKQYVFYRGDKVVNKKNPLPHPLRKKKANPDSKPQQESL